MEYAIFGIDIYIIINIVVEEGRFYIIVPVVTERFKMTQN